MWIHQVTAHAFGPLRGVTLELAPGLTVIHGPNESGKSTWHAALHAALCGRRRGAGATARDREFADRRRPWNHDAWLVSAEIRLADGRRVELRQDLDRRVDCHAKDLDLGTDLSAEVMHDGTPDASRWLGLDRRSFEATAFVAQTRMLDVLRDADGLQAHLQRAAATAGADADATAAGALRRIDAFRAEHVGRAQTNAVRPLQRAIVTHRAATDRLAGARAWHEDHERRQLAVQHLRTEAAQAQERLDRYEAAQLYARAAARASRSAEADALARALRDGPVDEVDPDTEAEVAAALGAGASAPAAAAPADSTVGDDELWELSRRLGLVDPDPEPPGSTDLAQARAAAARGRRRAGTASGVGAVLAVVGTVALAWGGVVPWAIALVLVGAGLTVGGLVWAGRTGAGVRAALAAAETADAVRRAVVNQRGADRRSARLRCDELGLPADPAALRDLARSRVSVIRESDRSAAAGAALVALAARLTGACDDVGAAVAALTAWQAGRGGRIERAERHRRDLARLDALLDGGTVESLAAGAAAAWQRAEATGYEPGPMTDDDSGSAEDHLAGLRTEARVAAQRLAAAEGSLEERRAAGPDVAGAEEALAQARTEEGRVRGLDDTLARTRAFLEAAQARAHRDIAPALADAVRRRLPAVTAGRYTDVIVDPADLHVEVCGADRRWRRAELLSHGTAEQVYLLLRIALVEHLARPGEPCPLILDDVVVHADAERAGWLLDLLREVARDRQVVLFTTKAPASDPSGHERRIALDRVGVS